MPPTSHEGIRTMNLALFSKKCSKSKKLSLACRDGDLCLG